MAGMTDTAFRRLVKRQGGCGLVVTEMVSSEGLVRGIDRTLEYAEFTEEERPVAVQIFGADPERMARAAQVVEKTGADVVDVNMGCPVPKVAKGNAGCSLMREPALAASIVRAMARAVSIPVTVKMRAGWNDRELNAPELAHRLEEAGAAAITVHGRTAAQSYAGRADWDLIARVARAVSIPVYGNGDCVEPGDMVGRLNETGVAGVLVGRGALRNPWIFAQAAALAAGRAVPEVSLADRGRFLLEYIDMLVGPERWVVNKLRALCAWYTRGLEGGSHLRVAVNRTESLPALRDTIWRSFLR
jgi:tRNA-dihydrouridine synthase B